MPKEPINGRELDFSEEDILRRGYSPKRISSEEDIQREQFGSRGVPGNEIPQK
jgi:hypothetical protein